MRIAYFTDTYFPEVNGVANTLAHLHDYLDRQGIEHIFFAPEYQEERGENGICRYPGFSIPFSPNSRLALPPMGQVLEKLKQFQPDLIHVVTEFTMGNIGVQAAKRLGIPMVMSYHTNIEQYLSYFHAELFERPVRAYFKRFHSQALANYCPSWQTYRQLADQGYRNLAVWSRGVDTELYSPEKRGSAWREGMGENKLMCLYVGRLSFEKGLDVYLDAIRIVNQKFHDQVEFVFAGDGPYRAEMESAHIDNVRFAGFVRGEALAELYASCDLFVFPSGTETFGNVLLEAMASGCACICSDSGGVTDFSRNGVNAWVSPCGDGAALANAIETLVGDPELRKKLAAGALETAGERSWDGVMDFLTGEYEKVLSQGMVKGA